MYEFWLNMQETNFIDEASIGFVGFGMFVNFVNQEQLAGTEGPFAIVMATNEKHFLAPKSNLHVGNLPNDFFLFLWHVFLVVANNFSSFVQVLVVIVIYIVLLGQLLRDFVHFHEKQGNEVVFIAAVLPLAMIFEAGDHSKSSAIVAMMAVVTRRVTMAPHDVIDESSLFLSIKLLIALRTLALLLIVVPGGRLFRRKFLLNLFPFLRIQFEEEPHSVDCVRMKRFDLHQLEVELLLPGILKRMVFRQMFVESGFVGPGALDFVLLVLFLLVLLAADGAYVALLLEVMSGDVVLDEDGSTEGTSFAERARESTFWPVVLVPTITESDEIQRQIGAFLSTVITLIVVVARIRRGNVVVAGGRGAVDGAGAGGGKIVFILATTLR